MMPSFKHARWSGSQISTKHAVHPRPAIFNLDNNDYHERFDEFLNRMQADFFGAGSLAFRFKPTFPCLFRAFSSSAKAPF